MSRRLAMATAATTKTVQTRATQDGLTLTAFHGDGSTLFAFDLDQALTPHLAGFALQCTPPNGAPFYVPNRLNFQQTVTSATTPRQRTWTPSDQAPFQKFRWVHFPPTLVPGEYAYTATAMYFADAGLRAGPAAQVSLELLPAQ